MMLRFDGQFAVESSSAIDDETIQTTMCTEGIIFPIWRGAVAVGARAQRGRLLIGPLDARQHDADHVAELIEERRRHAPKSSLAERFWQNFCQELGKIFAENLPEA